MWILAVLTVVILFICYRRSEDEKRHFSVDTYEIRSEKLTKAEQTFVFLSDLHDNCFGEGQKELLDAIGRVSPDGVLIGGDMMVTDRRKSRVDLESALFLVRKLAEKYPVYYGHGNHENRMEWAGERFGTAYQDFHRELKRAGVRVISGSEKAVAGAGIAVAGIDLKPVHYLKFVPEQMDISYMKEQLGEADKEHYQILLAHSPVFFDTYAAWGADLTLSGHLHGGTIRIPGLGGLMTPQFQFFYPYCAGLFEKAGRRLLVSRGLGTHSINIRLNNRAQLVVVKLFAMDRKNDV